jgi:endonuclease/exonuclease/phosphatase family metal-dependent hydrolase
VQPAADRWPEGEPRRWANRGWSIAAAALVTFGLVGALRVWLPSIVHVYGDAGSTPAVQMGLFALAWFLVPVPVVLSFRRIGPRTWWRIGIVALVLGRLALQATDGGWPQLATAGVTLVGGGVALVALAAGTPSGHLARVGVVLGLGVETVQHAALGTLDLAWRDGLGIVSIVIVLAAATLVVGERAARVPLWWPTPLAADGGLSPVWTRGAAWPWLVVGPAVILTGILVASPARLELAIGIGPRDAVLVLAVAAAAALVAAATAPVLGANVSGIVGAVLIVTTTIGALRPLGSWSAVSQLGVLVAIGFVLGSPTGPVDAGPRRRGAAAAASLLLLLLIGFGYYAAYELPLPFGNDVFLVLAAVGLAASSLAATRDGKRVQTVRGVPQLALAATAAIMVGIGVVVALVQPTAPEPEVRSATDGTVRVVSYNVHMGYDVRGRFEPDAIAAVLRSTDADVVVLNEIDRGWLLEGGHDLLRMLADRTGMEARFAPAADDIWGNAILSRLPVSDVTVTPLPREGAAMRRSMVSAVVDLGDGESLGIVGAHLHHVPNEPAVRLVQARAVAGEVSRLHSRGLPVAVLGDLNAAADAPELEPLAFLRDAVPGGVPTYPAHDPSVRLDHVLITRDLEASDRVIVPATASDHLPVSVTLRRRPAEAADG